MVPTTLPELALWLISPAAVGATISWLAERWPKFQALSPGWKAAVMLILAFILGGAAGGLGMVVNGTPENTIQLLNLVYAAGITGILILLGSQGWHQWYNLASKRMQQLPDLLKAAGADPNLIMLANMILAILKTVEEQTPSGAGVPPLDPATTADPPGVAAPS